MRKLLPILIVMLAICMSVSSAVRMNVAVATQLSSQKAMSCAPTQTLTVTASVANGVVINNIPSACIGKPIIVRVAGGLMASPMEVRGTVTGTTTTIYTGLVASLLGGLTSLANIQSQVLISGWGIKSNFAGVTAP